MALLPKLRRTNGGISMSWYSDGEHFDEYDPPYCERCSGGTSYEECQACARRHEEDEGEDE